MSAFEVASTALRVLRALVGAHPAVDARGESLLPLPAARRQLAAPAALPHLAQVRASQLGVGALVHLFARLF